MNKRMIATAAAIHVALAPSALQAAELQPLAGSADNRIGTFAGARLRVPLGGGDTMPHAGLALTSTLRSGASGQLRFAKGVEFGFSQGEKVSLKLGGQPVARLARGGTGPDGRRVGASTTEGLLIVGGIVVLALGGVALLLISQE